MPLLAAHKLCCFSCVATNHRLSRRFGGHGANRSVDSPGSKCCRAGVRAVYNPRQKKGDRSQRNHTLRSLLDGQLYPPIHKALSFSAACFFHLSASSSEQSQKSGRPMILGWANARFCTASDGLALPRWVCELSSSEPIETPPDGAAATSDSVTALTNPAAQGIVHELPQSLCKILLTHERTRCSCL